MRSDVGEGDLRRLLHHVTELPGERQACFAIHGGRLHEEDIAPGPGHGQPGGHPGDCGPVGHLVVVHGWLAEQLSDVVGADGDRGRVGGEAGGHLSHQLGQFALESPYPGLAGVPVDHHRQGVIADSQLVRFEPGPLQLARQQMIAGTLSSRRRYSRRA